MGFFSWKTSDTGRSIPNRYSSWDTFPVYMKDDKGNVWEERNYEGYGVFGGKDFYTLMDEMNGGSGDRRKGVVLDYGRIQGSKDVKCPKLFEYRENKWEDHDPPEMCEYQGYFYE